MMIIIMSGKTIEYVVRIRPTDSYQYLRVKQKSKIVFFGIQYEAKLAIGGIMRCFRAMRMVLCIMILYRIIFDRETHENKNW